MSSIKSQAKNLYYLKTKYAKNIRRFLPTFLDNLYTFLWQKSPHRGPVGIVWDVNNRCNAKCSFCEYWKFGARKKELSAKAKIKIIKDLGKSMVWQVSFCTGEPLLSEDLELLIREAKEKKMLVNISTNGSLLEEKAEMLINSGLDFITVSIDSHNPAIHDAMRGYPGLFARLEKGIETIRRLRKQRHPYITARCLINRKNAFALEKFVIHWKEKVDDILFKPIYRNPPNFYKIPAEMRFKPEDEYAFKKYYYGVLDKYKELDNLYHREIPNFLFQHQCSENKYVCFAGTFSAGIDCEGNLTPCSEFGEKMGNLAREDFMDIWKSTRMREFRKLLKTKAKCDNCWCDRFLCNLYIQKFFHLSGGKS